MAARPVPWLGSLFLVSLWGASAPGRRILSVRQGLPRGPGLTPSPLCPTASLLRRLSEHIQLFQESAGLGPSLSLGSGAVAPPKEGWLEQPLDPFNASDRQSFLQVRPGGGESAAYPAPSSISLFCPSASPFRSYLHPSVFPSLCLSVLSDACCQCALWSFSPTPLFLGFALSPLSSLSFFSLPLVCASGSVLHSSLFPVIHAHFLTALNSTFSLPFRGNSKPTNRSQYRAKIWTSFGTRPGSQYALEDSME